MASNFTWQTNTLFNGITQEKIMAKAHMAMNTEALVVQGKMQARRPWTDRSGQAKRTLSTTVEKKGTTLSMVLSHGVEYGKWLELRWGGRFSIIKPTLASESPRIIQSLNGLLNTI